MSLITITEVPYSDYKNAGYSLGDKNMLITYDGNAIQNANDTSAVLPPTKDYSLGSVIFWGQYASYNQKIVVKQKTSSNLYVNTSLDVKLDHVLVFRLEQTSSTNKEWVLFDTVKVRGLQFYKMPSSCPDCPQIKCPITPPCPSCPVSVCTACPQTPSAAIYTTMFFVLVIFLSLIWIVKKLLQKS